MATPISKLDHFKLETRFGDGYVENSTYQWQYSTRHATGFKRWEKVKMIGAGGFGCVWLEQEKSGGQLRAVKRIQRHVIETTGFSQELAALITLSDVCTSPTHFPTPTKAGPGVDCMYAFILLPCGLTSVCFAA